MANSLGALIVSLGLDATEFTSGLNKAQYQLQQLNDSVKKAGETIKTAFEFAAIYEVADQFKEMVEGSLNAEAALARLGDRAGLTGSQLSLFAKSARLSNTDLEDVVSMSARLSKALIEGADSTTKSATVLRALGISAKDLGTLLENPAQGIQRLAQVINQLPEGGTKAAAQLLILGRSGGTTSAFLKEVADAGTLVANNTDAQVAAAKRFEESLNLISFNASNTKEALANALLPTLQDLADAFIKTQTGAGSLREYIDKLASTGQFTKFAQDVALGAANAADGVVDFAKALGLLYDTMKAGGVQVLALGEQLTGLGNIASGNYAGILQVREGYSIMTAAGHDWAGQLDAITHRTTIADAVQRQFSSHLLSDRDAVEGAIPRATVDNDAAAKAKAAAAARAKAVQDALNAQGRTTAGGGADTLKKILDNQLAALNASIDAEKRTLSARDEFLSAYYAAGDISTAQFYQGRDDSIREGLEFQEKAYDQEIADTKAYVAARLAQLAKLQATGAIKPDAAANQGAAAQEDAQKRVIDITKRRSDAEQEAAAKSAKNWFDQRAAAIEYLKTVNELAAQVLTFNQNTSAATAIRFDTQNEQLRLRLQAEGNEEALKQLDFLKAQAVAQAAINDAQKSGTTIFDAIATAQSRVDLAVQSGNETDIQSYADKASLAQRYIEQLNKIADAQELAARASGDPAALQAVDNFRLHIEQLAASADTLSLKFRTTFEDAFSSALDGLINRTKTLRQTVDDFAKSIASSIGHVATTDIAQRLFGKDGPLGGVSDSLSKLFGGTVGSATAGASVSALGSAAIGATPALASLAAAATAAASALLAAASGATANQIGNLGFAGASAGGTAIGDLGGIFGGLFADGGDPPIGKVSIVGERGKEFFVPKTPGTIVPMSKMGGTTQYNSTTVFNLPASIARPSASQIATKSARETRRAVARLGA